MFLSGFYWTLLVAAAVGKTKHTCRVVVIVQFFPPSSRYSSFRHAHDLHLFTFHFPAFVSVIAFISQVRNQEMKPHCRRVDTLSFFSHARKRFRILFYFQLVIGFRFSDPRKAIKTPPITLTL